MKNILKDLKIKKHKKSKKNEKNASFNLLEVIVIIIMTSLIVGVSTGVIVYKNYKNSDVLNTVSESLYMDELKTAYNNIINGYVEKVDESKLVNAAIEGMYDYLGDPYTNYIDEVSTEDLTDRLNGEYTGIGVEITKVEGGILILTVFEGGPAKNSGLESGDVIVKVNKEDVTSLSTAEVSNMIKNSKSDKVEISFLRAGITITKEVSKKIVNVPSVSKENFNGIGYLKIDTFSNTTYSQFKSALEGLEKEDIKSLIIDVRNNGGGYLNSAYEIAELFIEKGKKIYGLENKNGKTFYEDKTKEKRDYKIAVLINGGSASASEILACALKESYGITVVGTKSYGKGTVQETSNLSSGGMVKYTTAYWLTPYGNKINKIGIKPDIEVKLENTGNYTYETDQQLNMAINAVK